MIAFVNFFKNNIFRNTISAKQLGSRSGPTICRAKSRFKLFAKVTSIQQKSRLASKELMHDMPQVPKSNELTVPSIFSMSSKLTLILIWQLPLSISLTLYEHFFQNSSHSSKTSVDQDLLAGSILVFINRKNQY